MLLFNRRVLPAWLALIIIVGAILFYHWRGLQPGQAFLPVALGQSLYPWRADYSEVPSSYLVSPDPLYIHYTFLQFNVRELQAGRFPLWDSGILSGHPAVADPLYQIFYPVWNILALLWGNTARAYTIGIGIHVLLAAGFTYALSRTWGHSYTGAIVAALTYALSGAMVLWLEMSLNLGTLTWFPAILFAYERALRPHSFKWTVLTAFFFALGCLAGHVQYMVTFTLFWGLYAIGKTIAYRLEHVRWNSAPLLQFGIALGLGGLGAAPLLLPLTEFLELTRRTTGPGLQSPFPITQLLTLWVPNYFGNPLDGNYWGANYTETTIYAGVVAFVLAVVAPFTTKRFMPRYLALMLIPFAYLMLGGPGIAALGEISVLKFINQARVFVVMPLAIALLAAETLTMARLPRLPVLVVSLSMMATIAFAIFNNVGLGGENFTVIREDVYRMAGLMIGLTLFVYGATFHIKGQVWARWGIVLLVFFDLYLWGHLYNPIGRVEDVAPRTPAIAALQRTDGYRTLAVQSDRFVLGMNLLSSFNIPEAGGYSSLVYRPILRVISGGDPDNAFGLPRYSNYLLFNRPTERLLELLQVKQVVSAYPLDGQNNGYELPSPRWHPHEVVPLFIYEDTTPLPRSAVYYDFEVITDELEAIARVHEATFRIRERAVLNQEVPIPATPLPTTAATILEVTPQRILIEATAQQAGVLVYGEMNYPGWQALVDGEPAPIITANAIWRGVVIPEGRHQVEFVFRPARFYWGLAGAGLALGLSVLLVWVTRQRKSAG
jgi:hypothetical protein